MMTKWIWLDDDQPNRYIETEVYFSAAREAELRISVEGQYVAFLNGERVPSTQHPDYPQRKSMQTASLRPLGGENRLVIQCWYPGADSSVYRKEPPGLWFELWADGECLARSGAHTKIRPMNEYVQGELYNITPQLGVAFGRQFAQPAPWQRARVVDKPAALVPRPIRELDVLPAAPSRVMAQGWFALNGGETLGQQMQRAGLFWEGEPTGDGQWLTLDLNALYEGYLTIDIRTPKPCKVWVGWGEHCEDLRVRTEIGARCFAVEVTSGTFTHWFRRIGCRYLQLFIFSREAEVVTASVHPCFYPIDEKPYLLPNDRLHQKIAQVSRDTLQACMHDHYEDCPWREQALYAFDSRNQMLAGYYAFGEFDYPRENLRLLALSQREDGLLELCAPARVPITIPMFSLIFIVSMEEYCRYSGDLAFGREMLPVCERIIKAFLCHVRDGLAWRFQGKQYWNYYEWSPLLDGGDSGQEASAEMGLQVSGILALRRLNALRSMLNLPPANETALDMLIDNCERFWDEEQGAYASFLRGDEKLHYAELIQAMALCAGAVPEHRAAALRMRLLDGSLSPITLSHTLFKYEALLQDASLADRVFDEIADRWGSMLFRGATTFWEVEEGAEAYGRAGSLCHAWCATPLYLYGAYGMGVRPSAPGEWTEHGTMGRMTFQALLKQPKGMQTYP